MHARIQHMNKFNCFIRISLSLILLTSSFANIVYAVDLQTPPDAKNTQTVSNDAIQEDTVSSKLQKNIKEANV